MYQIKEALKCRFCYETLAYKPIILTCCFQTICFKHITEFKLDSNSANGSLIKCKLCYKEIQSNEFPANTVAEEFMRLKIIELNFGKDYEMSKLSCDRLKILIDEIEATIKDPKHFIYESISELKSQIDLKREEIKLKIDTKCNAMINELTQFGKECDDNLNTKIFKDKVAMCKKSKNTIQSNLNKWTEDLEILIINTNKWESIRSKSVLTFNQMENLLIGIKNDLMLNKEFKFEFPYNISNNLDLKLISSAKNEYIKIFFIYIMDRDVSRQVYEKN